MAYGNLLHERKLRAETDIAFMVSFKVHRINDGSSPKVILKPPANTVYLAVASERRFEVLDA